MSDPTQLCRVELLPLGTTLSVPAGSGLQEVLFTQGVEFPCGGQGRCKGCRIKVLEGDLPSTEDDERLLSALELREGWRLACRARVEGALRIELAQWDAEILGDDRSFSFEPSTGLGIVIDLGTTTLVGQLIDRCTGQVLAVQSALNEQARHGADIMSRIEFAMQAGGQEELSVLIRTQLERMTAALLESHASRAGEVRRVILVGNTVMHHLFCGLEVGALSHSPFDSPHLGLQEMRPDELGWPLSDEVRVQFLPCLGGFVGSDILAGVLATGLHEETGLAALVDLGTNGEMVVGNRDLLLCASTAAGPAFEGARIAMGMRAATGAISSVRVVDGQFECHTLGQVDPHGICGSGLVDAVACGLELGRITASGRLQAGTNLALCSSVGLHQRDIRELQLAKGAIAAGLRILTGQLGAGLGDIERVHLAGAFGNYIDRTSAERIGLLPVAKERVVAAGNTALLGAKMALLAWPADDLEFRLLRARIQHVGLHEDPAFQEVYVEEMSFPAR